MYLLLNEFIHKSRKRSFVIKHGFFILLFALLYYWFRYNEQYLENNLYQYEHPLTFMDCIILSLGTQSHIGLSGFVNRVPSILVILQIITVYAVILMDVL